MSVLLDIKQISELKTTKYFFLCPVFLLVEHISLYYVYCAYDTIYLFFVQ